MQREGVRGTMVWHSIGTRLRHPLGELDRRCVFSMSVAWKPHTSSISRAEVRGNVVAVQLGKETWSQVA